MEALWRWKAEDNGGEGAQLCRTGYLRQQPTGLGLASTASQAAMLRLKPIGQYLRDSGSFSAC